MVAVLGGRGGAGASVLAGGLAMTGARGRLRTLLVDADPYGGGLDLVLGWEDLSGPRWPSLATAEGRLDAGAFVRALPSRGDLVMISFDRGDPLPLPAHAMAAALDAGRRARDLVVVDLPRHLDDAAVAALQSADHVFLVVPAELRATAAATVVAKAVAAHCAQLSVVVRGPAPGRLRPREVARSVGFPLAGYLRPDAALGEAARARRSPGRGPRTTGRPLPPADRGADGRTRGGGGMTAVVSPVGGRRVVVLGAGCGMSVGLGGVGGRRVVAAEAGCGIGVALGGVAGRRVVALEAGCGMTAVVARVGVLPVGGRRVLPEAVAA